MLLRCDENQPCPGWKFVVRGNVVLVRLQVVSSTAVGWRVGGQAGWQADRSGWCGWVGS